VSDRCSAGQPRGCAGPTKARRSSCLRIPRPADLRRDIVRRDGAGHDAAPGGLTGASLATASGGSSVPVNDAVAGASPCRTEHGERRCHRGFSRPLPCAGSVRPVASSPRRLG
jgi:hypothetical protein